MVVKFNSLEFIYSIRCIAFSMYLWSHITFSAQVLGCSLVLSSFSIFVLLPKILTMLCVCVCCWCCCCCCCVCFFHSSFLFVHSCNVHALDTWCDCDVYAAAVLLFFRSRFTFEIKCTTTVSTFISRQKASDTQRIRTKRKSHSFALYLRYAEAPHTLSAGFHRVNRAIVLALSRARHRSYC